MTTTEVDTEVWPYCQRCHHRFPPTHEHVREYAEKPNTRKFWEQVVQPVIEDIEWLLEGGESPAKIAERMGYSNPASLARRLNRRGRNDLANLFWGVHRRHAKRGAR